MAGGSQGNLLSQQPNQKNVPPSLTLTGPAVSLMPEMSDLPYWVAFHKASGMGRVQFVALEAHFGSLENAWKATEADFHSAGLDERTVRAIATTRTTTNPNEEIDRLVRHKIKAYTWHDVGYPKRLKEIYDLPPVLYVKGSITAEDDLSLAVVGTRRATAYGREVTQDLVWELAKSDITTVSGLAIGIDSVAHHTAMRAGGRTIAVLAASSPSSPAASTSSIRQRTSRSPGTSSRTARSSATTRSAHAHAPSSFRAETASCPGSASGPSLSRETSRAAR